MVSTAVLDEPQHGIVAAERWIRSGRLLRAAVLVPLVLVAFAGAIRVVNLSTPKGTYWDEHYYAIDAYAYLGGMLPNPGVKLPPAPTIYGETSWGHPPLGKLLIAAGVGPSDFSDVGSRLPSALFGTAAILLVYLIALELWGSCWWAALAGLLLAVDGLHLVQSRIATLDIFLSTFVLAGVFFLLRDRRKILEGTGDRSSPTAGRIEQWFGTKDRFWAGAMFGAAVAVKFNGAWALLLGAILTVVWLRANSHDDMERRRGRRTVALAFVAVPVAVYVLSYTEFFIQHPFDIVGFVRLQWYMLKNDVSVGGHFVPSTSSRPWTWPLLLHPIRYWSFPTKTGTDPARGSIIALGNPVLFWGFLLMLPAALYRTIRHRERALAIILGFYAVLYVPWLLSNRTQYFFYMLPCVPFMALALVGALRTLSKNHARAVGVTTAVLALGVAMLFAPVWLGLPTSSAWLAHLRWLPRWQ
jgi:dolichyl-phosphate-mannose--protein O-mannosyl transferase